jgi:putative transposase
VLVQEHGVPVRRACQAVRLSRAAYYRPPRSRLIQDADVVTALNKVVGRHSRWGFWKCFHRLRRAGHRWNHKLVHRVYCTLRLNLPRRTKRRIPARLRQPLVAPARLNETWALDFMAWLPDVQRHRRGQSGGSRHRGRDVDSERPGHPGLG